MVRCSSIQFNRNRDTAVSELGQYRHVVEALPSFLDRKRSSVFSVHL